jgi:tetratricopeptide (TPR) repeat protein
MGGEDVFLRANQLHLEGKFAEAEQIYDQILAQNHDNAGLLATMGTLYLSMSRPGLAISLLHRSIENSKEKLPEVLSNLGLAYKYTGQTEKALKYMERAATMKGATPESMATYGAMFVESGEAEKAIAICDKALKINPKLALAHWNKSLLLLEQGKWDTAWDEYEWGFASKMRIDRALGDIPVWDGTPGKTVWVYGEQGIGDEIMFASMLPDMLKTNKVILECHQRLVTLFEKSFGITCYGTREDKEIGWLKDHHIDARISIGSLGKFYRRNGDSFPGTPYLTAESLPRGRKMRVGISWTGGQKAGRVQKRTVPLSWWKSILSNDCEFVSLQYTDCAAEIEAVERGGVTIKQYDEVKAHDYYETAKLVKSCDLVISCCTSVIHLAGALGVPCWVLTPKHPAWRYQESGRMPWYRSVRLYRQPETESGAWVPVLERIGLDLSDTLTEFNKMDVAA